MNASSGSNNNSGATTSTSQAVSRILTRQITQCVEKSLNDFEFLEVLGKGSYSSVQRCVHKETKKQYAVKVSCKCFLRINFKNDSYFCFFRS
jgi:serine/threonine protein kinase